MADAPGPEFVVAAALQARLDIPADRLPDLTVAAAPVHELLRGLTRVDLGETAPACTFDPSWG